MRLDKHLRRTSNQGHSTSVDTVGNSVMSRSRVFLQCKEFKFSLINGPTDVIKSQLDKSQNLFMLMIPRAFLACLDNGSSILTKYSSRFILIFQGLSLFIRNSTGRQHKFLVAPNMLSIPTSSQSNVFSCLRPREGGDLSFKCLKVFSRVKYRETCRIVFQPE